MPDIDRILAAAPVIPVLVIDQVDDAVTIAEALVEGGLPAIEVTMRTPAALDAGAEFLVSPGLTDRLGQAAKSAGAAFLPGISNASEVMRALDLGFSRLKFFPAEAAGGLPALRALSAVFGAVRFCPTGGITPHSAQDWLDLPAVACIGGSWLAPKGGPVDRDAILHRARAAASLRAG